MYIYICVYLNINVSYRHISSYTYLYIVYNIYIYIHAPIHISMVYCRSAIAHSLSVPCLFPITVAYGSCHVHDLLSLRMSHRIPYRPCIVHQPVFLVPNSYLSSCGTLYQILSVSLFCEQPK